MEMEIKLKIKQNKTKQNKTKQNKTKQNKTKQIKSVGFVKVFRLKKIESSVMVICLT